MRRAATITVQFCADAFHFVALTAVIFAIVVSTSPKLPF